MSPKDGSVVDRIKTPEFMPKPKKLLVPLLYMPVNFYKSAPEESEQEKIERLLHYTKRKDLPMAWLWSEGRGPTWKRGWTRNAMDSMSAPPSPLLAILLIIFLLLYLSSHASYSHQMQQTTVNLKLLLLFLPVILILVAQFVYKFDRLVYPNTKAGYGSVNRSWDMPWGVLGLVVLLLVMISYRSSLQSMWSPIVRRYDY